ncbi:MAG: hypothetical protein ACLQVM_06040 [Terriglobia bacterium]
MKRVLILMLAITTLAAARDKKPKAQPGPYVFTSKASAQTLKTLIVQDSLKDGYTLDSDCAACLGISGGLLPHANS